MKKISMLVIFASLCFCMMSGCKNDKDELINPPPGNCGSGVVTYSNEIVPILRNNCYRCHAGSSTVGPFNLDSYQALQVRAANGQFWGAVSHSAGYSPMPKDRPQLSPCDLAIIRKWLDEGYPNN